MAELAASVWPLIQRIRAKRARERGQTVISRPAPMAESLNAPNAGRRTGAYDESSGEAQR